MKNIRAQSIMEFSILVGLAFLAAILFIAIAASEIKDFKNQKELFLVEDLALKLQKEVTIASSVEDGYERSFELPNKLESSVDYFTIVMNNTITVNSSKAVFHVAVPAVYGKNFTKGSNTIEKIGGKVYVNKDT